MSFLADNIQIPNYEGSYLINFKGHSDDDTMVMCVNAVVQLGPEVDEMLSDPDVQIERCG